MKNMSFALTTKQVADKSKTVTRRMGWKHLQPGDEFQPVEKGMGLKKGEKVTRIGAPVKIVSNIEEPLRRLIDDPVYGQQECIKEGFPDLTPAQFVQMFCETHEGCTLDTPLSRIEFAYENTFMVFDVESIGLHGEGFAVAWVVVTRSGVLLEEACLACDPAVCSGSDSSRLWVAENVPALEVTSPTPQHLRNTFWHEWRKWADQGAVLVADCAWPVEANFLSACVNLNRSERERQGPYPLHDLASVLMANGADALAMTDRLPDELPAHHPLMDARQSARQLVTCLQKATPSTRRRS